NFHLHPMKMEEAREYLHVKVLVAGCNKPETLFPGPVCDALWQASGGWPGILDRVALLALSKAKELPLNTELIDKPALPEGTWNEDIPTLNDQITEAVIDPPSLFVTLDGLVRQKLTMDDASRVLIGRSEHNDITLASKFVSRHHALMVRIGRATFVMDLNSTNGIFVNSKRVTNQFLMNDDVISIGNYRIKFIDPSTTEREIVDSDTFADTAILKTLDDMRNLLAQGEQNSPARSTENLPTASS
ncbi:MAG: FHA domain-containing protein, partial [Woeseiaceae bacterium]